MKLLLSSFPPVNFQRVLRNFCMFISDILYSWKNQLCLINGVDGIILFVDDRRGQGIKGIMQNINKPKMTSKTFYKPLLFESIKRMDPICVVQFLHYKSMMGLLCFKPLSFCVNEPSLYPRNVVGIFIKLIFLGGGIFLNNHNNVVFAWIFCMIYITYPKMRNDILTFF